MADINTIKAQMASKGLTPADNINAIKAQCVGAGMPAYNDLINIQAWVTSYNPGDGGAGNAG